MRQLFDELMPKPALPDAVLAPAERSGSKSGPMGEKAAAALAAAGASGAAGAWASGRVLEPAISVRLACTAVAPVLTAKNQKPTFEVTEVIANSGVHAVFAKTSQRKFALRAISEEDMVDWICVLKTGATAT